MRYLIHSDNCEFDSSTGKHSIVLDRRIANPSHLQLVKCVYEAPTDAGGVYPLAVYFRSEGINDLVRNKHTIQLTQNNHENEADVLAVLKESTSAKRYVLEKERATPMCAPSISTLQTTTRSSGSRNPRWRMR